jgi:4-amino-4-deoxy-L-arabinose transferase-like glycosyltransferase
MRSHPVSSWALLIFCLAFALRFFHVLSISRNSPFFDILPGDLQSYDRWASKIAVEGWMGTEIFYQDPLYPYFLAVIYKLTGRDFFFIYVIQSFLGAGAAVLIFLVGEKILGRASAVLGGLLYALYSPAIYFDGLLLKVSLSTFLFVASVYSLLAFRMDKPSWSPFASGLLLGLAVLARANFLLVTPVVVVALCLNRGAVRKKRFQIAGLFLLGHLLVLFPVAMRNYWVGRDLVLTTAQAGQNFYIGHNPRATGTYVALPFVRPNPVYERKDFHREAERRLGRLMRPSEVSHYWFGEGLRFIRDNPGTFLKLLWRKLLLFLNHYEIADNHNFYCHRRYSIVIGLSPITFALVGPFFLLGIITVMRDRRRATMLFSSIQVVYMVSVVSFYVYSRYRMPMMPLFCLMAGHALQQLGSRIRDKHWKPLVIPGAVLATAFVFVNYPVIRPFNFTASFTDEGIAYAMKGNDKRAILSFEEALKIRPNSLRALKRLYRSQLRLGHYRKARETRRRIHEIMSRSTKPHRAP